MKKIICILALILSSSAFANDKEHHQGKTLHDDKCTSCHKDEVYSRKDRNVKTLSALQNQVNNCMKGAAKAEWTQSQTASVVDFLNDRYYKF